MKTDKMGCSTCAVGQETYETFLSNGKTFYQYDYRNINGDLFSCIGKSLEECRLKRDKATKEKRG